MTWVPASYLYRRGQSSMWCNTFKDDGPDAEFTLGAAWMLNHEVVFDMDSGRLGIAPAICPEYHLGSLDSTSSRTETSFFAWVAAFLFWAGLPVVVVWACCQVVRHYESSKYL